MSSLATVCINNNLTTRQTGISMRTTDHKLSSRIHMIDNIIIEQSLNMSRILSLYARDQYTLDIFCDLFLHSQVRFFLCDTFCSDKFIMLCRNNNRIDTQRFSVIIIFNRHLTLCIRTEVRHQVVFILTYLGKLPQ